MRLRKIAVAAAIAATAALALPGSATAAAPANDDVQNAQVITSVDNNNVRETRITGDNSLATAQTGEPHGTDSLGSDRSTVWYSWTPYYGGGNTAVIELCATFQPVLGTYTKAADPVPPFSNLTDHGAIGDGTAGLCSYDSGGFGVGFLELFGTDAGQTYYFQVAGWSGSGTGPFELNLDEFPPDQPLPPDATPPPAAPLATPAVKKKCKHKRSGSAAKKKKCKKKRKK
jgi:hypothetical protein